MTWELVIPLIIKYGLPFAEDVFNRVTSGKDPTGQDFIELRAMTQVTPRSKMIEQLNAAGIALDSPQGLALLALVQ